MKHVKLLKRIKGLPYKPGDLVPVSKGRFGYVWHVWICIIELPEDSYEEYP